MRIAIFGSGAVGASFGALLARAGEDLVFVARGRQLEAMRERGVRIDRPDETVSVAPVQVSDDPSDFAPVDLVLLGVKTWQVEDAARAMGPLITDHTGVLTLQNGVEAHDTVAQIIGPRHVLPGICRIICAQVEPGVVQDLGFPLYIGFAESDGSPSTRADRIVRTLEGAGIGSDVEDDIHRSLWEKFMFITSASGVGAVTRCPKGVFFRVTESRRMLEEVMREIFAVGAARGINWEGDPVQATLEFIETIPDSATTSMQRDIMDGRPSELEAQTGAVVRLGRESNVPTPVSDAIYAALAPQERRARGEIDVTDAAFASAGK